MVQLAESLSSAIPLHTSTERANSKIPDGSHLFQDAVPCPLCCGCFLSVDDGHGHCLQCLASSTSCPAVMHRLPSLPWYKASVAMVALLHPLELVHRVLNRHLGQCGAPRIPAGPLVIQVLTRATWRCWSLLFLRR